MVATQETPLFFVHVMKTAGASLRHQLNELFDGDEVFPSRAYDSMYDANRSVPMLLALPAERRARIRVYMGHVPYVAAELLGEPVVTLTMLREPVSRVVSMLKHLRLRVTQRDDQPYDEIYDDPVLNAMYLRNHQAKVFAFTKDDPKIAHTLALAIDEDRLRIAKQHIARVDILGFTDTYLDTLTTLEKRFGWNLGSARHRNVSPRGEDVSPALLRRIERDNAADIEFYEHARRLYGRTAPSIA